MFASDQCKPANSKPRLDHQHGHCRHPALASAELYVLKERYANSFQATVESMTLDFDHLGNLFFAYVIDFAGAVLIAVVGWWLAGVIERGTRRVLMSSPHMDLTVGNFLSSLARYATLVIVFVIILQVIGVQATSLVAVIGAASLAVGLALQGTLTHMAAGAMLLIFQPFRIGTTSR